MVECLKDVNKISETNEVHILWVLGHHGIEGNEEADAMAKKGSNNPFLGPEPMLRKEN